MTPKTSITHIPVALRAAILVGLVLIAMTASPAKSSGDTYVDLASPDDTIESPQYSFAEPHTYAMLAAQETDPLGLVRFPAESRRYSLGTDVFEVWECPSNGPVPMTASEFSTQAVSRNTDFFSWMSGGKYTTRFVVGGSVPTGQVCSTWARTHSAGASNAALFILAGSGGIAGPGYTCPGNSAACPTTYPDNVREGFVGVSGSSVWTIVAHEIGHMLSWPHTGTGVAGGEYDNAIDLMSGNFGTWNNGSSSAWGTYYLPYPTAAINRYASGWIDSSDVIVWDGSTVTESLEQIGGVQNRMLVIDDGSTFSVLAARAASNFEAIRAEWDGVEIYQVARCNSCWGLNALVRPQPAMPFDFANLALYNAPLPHVLPVGKTILLGDANVAIISRETLNVGSYGLYESFTVRVSSPYATRFTDVQIGNTFLGDIEWLAEQGITFGCNPPSNTRFCPSDSVTRGQMAAFLVRALNLPASTEDFFVDESDSVFQANINTLAAAGITRGCNPPTRDRFCPTQKVTRGQMAAFLSRAFSFTEDDGLDPFGDIHGSIFAKDINLLRTAGITKGCFSGEGVNNFCPDSYVTRGQMAAFLHRALG